MPKSFADEWWEHELNQQVPPTPTPLQFAKTLLDEAGVLFEYITENEKMANGYPPLRIVQICAKIAAHAQWIATKFHDQQVTAIQNASHGLEQELNR